MKTTSNGSDAKPLGSVYKRPGIKPVWCPGCGDYGALTGAIKSFGILGLKPENIACVSGIGCSGRFSHYLNVYAFHGTHGRALPTATGVKTARPELTVLAVSGDGDGLGIGGGHIPHTARRNVDMTYLILDNQTYSLTKGQVSPTSPKGSKTKTSPYGAFEDAMDVMAVFLAYDVSFLARTSSFNQEELVRVLTEAVRHKGFSIVYVYSPCVTFPVLSWETVRGLLKPIPESHDTGDKMAAMEYAYSSAPLYTGIFYRKDKPTLEERLEDQEERALAKASGYGTYVTLAEIMREFY